MTDTSPAKLTDTSRQVFPSFATGVAAGIFQTALVNTPGIIRTQKRTVDHKVAAVRGTLYKMAPRESNQQPVGPFPCSTTLYRILTFSVVKYLKKHMQVISIRTSLLQRVMSVRKHL
jgi:hypothetical protein